MTVTELLDTPRRWVRSLMDSGKGEIEVDIYAGAGGASLGIEKATGRPVVVAINHDPNAISIHKLNHPGTHHFLCDVREVDPRTVMPGRPIGLLHLSPDCTHHSRAKGGKPVQRHVRALANVGIVWAAARLPRVITLENVAEFLDWGPLMRRRVLNKKTKKREWVLLPDPTKKGQSFKAWVRKLKRLGYAVDWRILRAADFGAPTIRKRLFLVARRDGQPIKWPTPTHAPADQAELLGLQAWRSAASCIAWELLGRSIFNRRKPLALATNRRLAKGTVKHVLQAKKGPFMIGSGGPIYAGKPVPASQPLGTITKENHRAVATPFLATLNHSGEGFRGQDLDNPMSTITAADDAHGLTTAHLTHYHGSKRGEGRDSQLDLPLHTLDKSNRFGLTGAFLAQIAHYNGRSERTRDINDPIQTLTAHKRGGDQALGQAFLVGVGGRAGQSPTRGVDQPMRTTTSKADDALAAAFLQDYNGQAASPVEPVRTLTKIEGEALAAAMVVRFKKGGMVKSPSEPVGTITQKESDGLAAAHIVKHYTGVVGHQPDQPLGTVTTQDHNGLQVAYLEVMKGTGQGYDPRKPMPTIQAQGNHIAEVRLFLKEFYDGYEKLTALEKLGILDIEGVLYQIVDITLRMLEPFELLRAQFGKYAEGYKLSGSKKVQVAGIGNSVCPEVEEALVRANYKPLLKAA